MFNIQPTGTVISRQSGGGGGGGGEYKRAEEETPHTVSSAYRHDHSLNKAIMHVVHSGYLFLVHLRNFSEHIQPSFVYQQNGMF